LNKANAQKKLGPLGLYVATAAAYRYQHQLRLRFSGLLFYLQLLITFGLQFQTHDFQISNNSSLKR